MDFNREASIYLTKISNAVLSLSRMLGCDQSEDVLRKVTVAMLELEQNTADLINELGLPAPTANTYRDNCLYANRMAVARLQKIQPQSQNFSELITALKLENDTLKKELTFN